MISLSAVLRCLADRWEEAEGGDAGPSLQDLAALLAQVEPSDEAALVALAAVADPKAAGVILSLVRMLPNQSPGSGRWVWRVPGLTPVATHGTWKFVPEGG